MRLPIGSLGDSFSSEKDGTFGRIKEAYKKQSYADELLNTPPARIIFADFDNTIAETDKVGGRTRPISRSIAVKIEKWMELGKGELYILSTRAEDYILNRLKGIKPDAMKRIHIYGRFGARHLKDLIHRRNPHRAGLSAEYMHYLARVIGPRAGVDVEGELREIVSSEILKRNPDMKVYKSGEIGICVLDADFEFGQTFAIFTFYDSVQGGYDPREQFLRMLSEELPGAFLTLGGRASLNISLVDKADLIEQFLRTHKHLNPGEIIVVDDEGKKRGTGFKMLNLAETLGVTGVLVGKEDQGLSNAVIRSPKEGPEGFSGILDIEIDKLWRLKRGFHITPSKQSYISLNRNL